MGGHLVTRRPGAQVEAGQGRGHQAGTVGVRAEAGVAPIQTAALGVSEIMKLGSISVPCLFAVLHLLARSPPGPGPGPPHPLRVPELPRGPGPWPGSPGPDFLGQILIIAMQFSATGGDDQSSCNKRLVSGGSC